MENVQREKLEQLIAYAKEYDLPLGASEEEINKLLHDLENDQLKRSNDTEIDLVIDTVYNYTDNLKLLSLLDEVMAKNFASTELNAFAFLSETGMPEVVATRLFLKKLEQLSNVAATVFLQDYFKLPYEAIIQFLISTVYALDHNYDEDFEETYAYAQGLLQEYDEQHPEAHLSDHLVYFGREIYESALAFIIGHEIGHHYHNHVGRLLKEEKLNTLNTESNTESLGNTDSAVISNWDHEFLADDFGIYFTVNYVKACLSRGNDFPFLKDSIFHRCDYRFFGIMVAYQLMIQITRNAKSSTHPAASDRLARSLEMLTKCGFSDIECLIAEYQCLINTLKDARTIIKSKEEKAAEEN